MDQFRILTVFFRGLLTFFQKASRWIILRRKKKKREKKIWWIATFQIQNSMKTEQIDHWGKNNSIYYLKNTLLHVVYVGF